MRDDRRRGTANADSSVEKAPLSRGPGNAEIVTLVFVARQTCARAAITAAARYYRAEACAYICTYTRARLSLQRR